MKSDGNSDERLNMTLMLPWANDGSRPLPKKRKIGETSSKVGSQQFAYLPKVRPNDDERVRCRD